MKTWTMSDRSKPQETPLDWWWLQIIIVFGSGIFAVVGKSLLILMWSTAIGAFSEEALYYMAPIAVAVLAYLLDHRAARRHEHYMEETATKIRNLELTMVSYMGDVGKSLAIADKCLEHLTYRLESLEGTDGGVSKEHGEALARNQDDLRESIATLAIRHHELDGRLKRVESEDD